MHEFLAGFHKQPAVLSQACAGVGVVGVVGTVGVVGAVLVGLSVAPPISIFNKSGFIALKIK